MLGLTKLFAFICERTSVLCHFGTLLLAPKHLFNKFLLGHPTTCRPVSTFIGCKRKFITRVNVSLLRSLELSILKANCTRLRTPVVFCWVGKKKTCLSETTTTATTVTVTPGATLIDSDSKACRVVWS